MQLPGLDCFSGKPGHFLYRDTVSECVRDSPSLTALLSGNVVSTPSQSVLPSLGPSSSASMSLGPFVVSSDCASAQGDAGRPHTLHARVSRGPLERQP